MLTAVREKRWGCVKGEKVTVPRGKERDFRSWGLGERWISAGREGRAFQEGLQYEKKKKEKGTQL